MQRCPECNARLESGLSFCRQCGTTFSASDSTAEETTAQAPVPGGTPQQQPIPMKANPHIAGTRCLGCQIPITSGQDVMKCGGCETVYHTECWEKADGCTSSTCPANTAEAEETKVCPSCRQRVKKTETRCRYCGEYIDLQESAPQKPQGTLKQASEALNYALVGILCFGIILEPIALYKGIKALNTINANPQYQGKGKAIAAIIISSVLIFLWVIGIISRLSGF